MTMTPIKKLAAGAVMVGALGFAAGLGASQAVADDYWWDPPGPGHIIPPPGHIAHIPGVPPPGHIAHIPGVPPPGHWDKPWKWWR